MAQQQGQGGDNSMGPIWSAAGILLLAVLIWYMGHQHIVAFIFFFTTMQAKLMHLFVGGTQLANDISIMENVDPSVVTLYQLDALLKDVGEYVRYPVIIFFVIMAGVLYQSDIIRKYRRAHSMKTLRAQEQQNWPAIMPVVKQDLVNTDISTGPWAMALTPMEFARKHNLLKKNDALMSVATPGEEMTASIRRGDAKRVFTLQLGPVWNGFEQCPPHARAVAAVFMARMNRDKAAAFHILSSLDKSISEGKPNYNVAIPTLKKYQKTELVQAVLSQHAYLLTVIASLLEGSRDDGVMPSSDFLWLKTVDRRLWYMLNCVGRQTPYVEVGGPFAHWIAEKIIGHRSLTPMIDEAINALELAVKEIKLSPDELRGLQS